MRELTSQIVLADLGKDAIRFDLLVEASMEHYAFIEPSLFPVGQTLKPNGHHFPHLRGNMLYKYVNDQIQSAYLADPTEGAELVPDSGSLFLRLTRNGLVYWVRFNSSDEEGIPCRVSPLLERKSLGGLFAEFEEQQLQDQIEAAKRNIDLRVTWVWESGEVDEEQGSIHRDTLLSMWIGGSKAWTISIKGLAQSALMVTEPSAPTPARPASPYMPQEQGEDVGEVGS